MYASLYNLCHLSRIAVIFYSMASTPIEIVYAVESA